MISTKIPHQKDGRIESKMVATKNNPKLVDGWMDGELNDWHKITTPDGWTDRELNGAAQR